MVRLTAFLRACNASEGEASLEPAGGAPDVFGSLDGEANADADVGDGTRAVAEEIQSLEKFLLATERQLAGERAECEAAKEAALAKVSRGGARPLERSQSPPGPARGRLPSHCRTFRKKKEKKLETY